MNSVGSSVTLEQAARMAVAELQAQGPEPGAFASPVPGQVPGVPGQVNPMPQQVGNQLQMYGATASQYQPAAVLGENRLFVSRVPLTVSKEDLRVHFFQFGAITDVYIPAPPGSPGHKGICFISYVDISSMQRALAQQSHVVNGELISVEYAAPRAPPPQTVTASISNGSRLFLTKLTPDIGRADLQSYFSQFGELVDCYVPPGNKGIAFVSYRDPNVAQAVLSSPQHQIKPGQVILVTQAYDRPPQGAFKGGPKGGGFVVGPNGIIPGAAANWNSMPAGFAGTTMPGLSGVAGFGGVAAAGVQAGVAFAGQGMTMGGMMGMIGGFPAAGGSIGLGAMPGAMMMGGQPMGMQQTMGMQQMMMPGLMQQMPASYGAGLQAIAQQRSAPY